MYGNLSIYIRISRSSSAHWQKPLPFVPVLHTWLSTTMPRDHQCTLEEEVAAESWRNTTFIPHQNSPAIFIPGRLSQLPVLRSQPLSLLGWANGVLCSTEFHRAAIAEGPAHLGRGRTGQSEKPLGLLLPLGMVNQGGLEVPCQRWAVLIQQSPVEPSSASCAGRTPSSSAPAPAASSAAAPLPPAPAPCWPWHQPGWALQPGNECPARKGIGLETRQCPARAQREEGLEEKPHIKEQFNV